MCGAASGALAWTASIPTTVGALGLVDIAAGPTDDVVVADTLGATLFEQHRWSSAGAVLSTHADAAGAYTGPLYTSGLFIDPGNDAFYGIFQTGPAGADTEVNLAFTRLGPGGAVAFTRSTHGSLPTSGGAPSGIFLQVGGDADNQLHGAFHIGAPAYVGDGVYCYVNDGTSLGASAQNVTSLLTPKDFVWPSQDNNLILFKGLTATTSFGCGASLNVPAGGAVALAKFSGGVACLWNKLLDLPTAAVKAQNFRLGADGSMMAAIVYTGTVDFGSGPLTSTGTSSLALARFDSTGNLLWAKSFGGAGSRFEIGSVGANAAGNIVLTAGYAGTVDLGGGALPANHDTFLAVFVQAGEFRWSRPVTVGGQGALLAAAGMCGVVMATSSPTVDLGTGPLSVIQSAGATLGVAALGM